MSLLRMRARGVTISTAHTRRDRAIESIPREKLDKTKLRSVSMYRAGKMSSSFLFLVSCVVLLGGFTDARPIHVNLRGKSKQTFS